MDSFQTSINNHAPQHTGYSIHPNARPFLLPGTSDRGVLLIHGFTSSPYHFREFAESLHLRNFTVLSMLLPGHGTHPDHLNRVQRKDWYVAVRDAFLALSRHVDHVSVIGDSYGGILAYILAALSRERSMIDHVVSIGSPVYIRGDWHKPFLPVMKRVRPLHRKPWARGLPKNQFITDHATYTYYPLFALHEMYRSITHDCLPNLPRVSAPSLILHDRSDERVKAKSAHTLYRSLGSPVKELRWLEGYGHVAFENHNTDLFETIYKFLTKDFY